ncbi:MAG: SulP family inorganic anion transporter [Cyanobacteria bacterium P01_A01_bin.116]
MNNVKRRSPQSCLVAWMFHELQPKYLIATLTAGVVSGLMVVIYSISIAMLIFSGQLAPFISTGLGFIFLNAIFIAPFVAFTNSLPGAIADPQDVPASILAVMASEIVVQFPNDASASLPTVMMAISVTAFLVGSAFFLLGTFQLGHLSRFIPYPVIGGFLAGTGYLFVQGAFKVMTDQSLGWLQLPWLFQPALLIRWMPGLVIASTLFILLRRYHNTFLLPSLLAGFTVLFYLILRLSQTSTASAREAGLLMEAFSGASLWQPLHWSMFSQVDWSLIADQSGNIATTVLLSVIVLLLNASGLDLATQQEIDLNRELRSAGMANLMVGLVGGTVGYQSLSLSTLNCARIGAKSRLVGVVVALICLLTWGLGDTLITLFPKPLLGGVLLYLGLSLLVEWLYDAWFRLSVTEYGMVVAILVTIAFRGVLPGVGAGLLISCFLWVVNYRWANDSSPPALASATSIELRVASERLAARPTARLAARLADSEKPR